MEANPEIPIEYFSKWTEIITKLNSKKIGNWNTHEKTHETQPQDKNLVPSGSKGSQGSRESDIVANKEIARIKAEIELKEPTELDFDIPTNEKSHKLMVKHFASIGLARWEADKAIENKRMALNWACCEFKKAIKKKTSILIKWNKQNKKKQENDREKIC